MHLFSFGRGNWHYCVTEMIINNTVLKNVMTNSSKGGNGTCGESKGG